ncbi:L-threonine aldolase [Chitinophaga terrae (ex Kim and Jung 2007)]|uniref:L-threonine aldolase n=1 Tax=Chitinophaga terrae (ex Kim and Jung 2007) TaxID=408074 RepID=A0A1H3WYN6_9BACT|nr:GntG family PLP-dependent aldolase [Chitinophaga terrae (ex Kim and Jung 2007)]MDQ0106986.1 threonine aldolase [Chitinophaga terrae (ex Kim and Jung 2007)]GEP90232.1 threonine aldolase [Chitinophaga terrae (ex Kim and Jung 2007)]SDZ92219.1 L-threonine aldolase [Chitinophaga terrae (ex Kim and Jung 2007)]
MIDFRSDTFTRPTPGMLQAMITAETGDDVFGEDPSVNKLEARMADYFGKAAALYCPSGTMSNQIAIKVHTQPGDEVVCSDLAHVYIYEGGGIAFNAGAQTRPIAGDRGMITAAQVKAAINPDDVHKARTSLVCLENTSNRGGGCIYDWQEIEKIAAVCREHELALHLDGARLFNALVATGQDPKAYGKTFDTISVCLNKGMGCPMGSVLLGSETFIKAARRIRKKLGGGLRQAGFMAATGLYALENHINRLAEDHAHARQIADVLNTKSFVSNMLPVETNILIFDVSGSYTPATFVEALQKEGILVVAISPTQIRIVTHLDITPDMVAKTCQVIAAL